MYNPTRRGPGLILESQCYRCYPAPVPQVYSSLGFTCILGHPCQQVRGGQYPYPGPTRNRSYRKRRRGRWDLVFVPRAQCIGTKRCESLFLCPRHLQAPWVCGPQATPMGRWTADLITFRRGNPGTTACTVTLSGHRALSGVSCPPQRVLADHPHRVSTQQNQTRLCRLSESKQTPPKRLTQTV